MVGQARAGRALRREQGQAQPTAEITPAQLSRREREVALLIAQGLPNRQIGAALAIKERTVEDHVSRLLRKLHLSNRAQVILWAIASGLVSAPTPVQEPFAREVGKM
jgi:DNA-binding NarL/FixJ family response regulator